jgi:uncharacterized protein (DUF433 family)
MATVAKVAVPHIEKTPGVRAGKACIEGTRIAVVDIVRLHEQGHRPEEMLGRFVRPLSLGQVYAALLYYQDNPEEIEDYFRREGNAHAEHERMREDYLGRRPAE